MKKISIIYLSIIFILFIENQVIYCDEYEKSNHWDKIKSLLIFENKTQDEINENIKKFVGYTSNLNFKDRLTCFKGYIKDTEAKYPEADMHLLFEARLDGERYILLMNDYIKGIKNHLENNVFQELLLGLQKKENTEYRFEIIRLIDTYFVDYFTDDQKIILFDELNRIIQDGTDISSVRSKSIIAKSRLMVKEINKHKSDLSKEIISEVKKDFKSMNIMLDNILKELEDSKNNGKKSKSQEFYLKGSDRELYDGIKRSLSNYNKNCSYLIDSNILMPILKKVDLPIKDVSKNALIK
jgi:hypothetical protein